MRAREPNSIDAIDAAHRAQKIGKQRASAAITKPLVPDDGRVVGRRVERTASAREIAAVGVHVLSEQRDFPDAIAGKAFNFGQQFAERTTDLATANGRNDAVGTGVVATNLDSDPGRPIDFTSHCERRGERCGVIKRFVPDFGDGSGLSRFVQQLHRAVHVVSANNNIDVSGTSGDGVAIFLRQATAHDDFHIGAFFFDVLEATEMPVELVIGVLTDAAGVEHHDVGGFIRLGKNQPIGFEEPSDTFGIVLVHLTPIGADGVAAGLISHGDRLPGIRERSRGPVAPRDRSGWQERQKLQERRGNQSSSEIGTSCSALMTSSASSGTSAFSPIPILLRMRSVISTMTSGFSSR